MALAAEAMPIARLPPGQQNLIRCRYAPSPSNSAVDR